LSIVYGPESSSKTNIVLKAIAHHQLLWPEKTCVFVDVENSFNPIWATLMGVNVDRLVVLSPDYAEQTVDMVEGFMDADDCGLVAVDSIAAMITTNEAEGEASKAAVGGVSVVVGKLVRKTTLCFRKASKEGRMPTLIFINQVRHKVGVMYGNPETAPGGNAPNFAAALKVRVSGKNIMDNKVSKVMPVAKETHFVIQKFKVPVLAVNGMFTLVTQPHNGMMVGECDDWNTIAAYLKKMALLAKAEKGPGWVMLGEEYPTLKAAKERLYTDKMYGTLVRKQLIEKCLAAGAIQPEDEAEVAAL
jgi:recombination protein RecA